MVTKMRVGHGYDIHRFEEPPRDQYIVLGGVQIPYEKNLLAHSDGDVVIHALCDALLGACALGDIGQHFPDTDIKYKNFDSRIFLREVIDKVRQAGFSISNIDITIIAQAPRLAAYLPNMKKIISEDLNILINQINLKATTHEGLDALGQKMGIAAHAVVLLS